MVDSHYHESRVIFIGGLFPSGQRDVILFSSRGVIQNAADVFQTALTDALDEVVHTRLTILNLPFVGSYPRKFKSFFFPSHSEKMENGAEIIGLGFVNLLGFKHFFRFLTLFNRLKKIKVSSGDTLILYSMHLPFIAAVWLYKKLYSANIKTCLIVPDLPEYMSDSSSIIYRMFKAIDGFLMHQVISVVDKYVLLTSCMAKRLSVSEDNYIVVEGVCGGVVLDSVSPPQQRFILYSGTLAARYGIRELVEVFSSINDSNLELWICGGGDSEAYIVGAATRDVRIKYLGQLPRSKVLELQAQAAVLVNPRPPAGEFTKYSFPSKIIEYMASGRPVVMYRLQGIPDEYFEFCFTPGNNDSDGLRQCLLDVLSLRDDELSQIGFKAREFIYNNKSARYQAEKMLNFLEYKIN